VPPPPEARTQDARRRRRLRWALATLIVVVVAGGLAVSRYGPRTAPPPTPVANRAFTSPPSPTAPAVVWAVGDGADGGDAAQRLAQRIAADRPARLLYLGDVYERGSSEDFREGYGTVYGPLAAATAPTPGNHEWPAHRDGYDPYWRARTGTATPPWYSFRIGGWRILSLNSEAPHGTGSAQLAWLRRELRRDAGTCALAFWHRPLQSAGRHGDQDDVAPLWDALRGKASLVINAHDHDSQRFRARDGIVEYVAGAGGKSRYGLGDDPRLAFGDDEHDAALRLELRGGAATLAFVSSEGDILDRSTVTCRPEPGKRTGAGTPGPRRPDETPER
jgi:hypothetical protein